MPDNVFILPLLTYVRYAWGFDFLMSSLILMIMNNGNWHCGSPEMRGSQPKPQSSENWKIYTINQIIKICAEYWDIVPKALKDLSDTPALSDSKLTNLPWPWVPVPVFCIDCHLYNKTYVGLSLSIPARHPPLTKLCHCAPTHFMTRAFVSVRVFVLAPVTFAPRLILGCHWHNWIGTYRKVPNYVLWCE